MNILQIANKATFPSDGGTLAILNLSMAYAKNGNQVHILNMVTHKHYNKNIDLGSQFNNSIKISGINVNIKISLIKIFVNLLFSRKAYIAERFRSKKYAQKLIDLIKTNLFDFIQVEGLYVLQYINLIKSQYKGPIVYRPHNIEYIVWERNYQSTKSLFKELYFKNLSKRLRNLELSLLNKYDYILPITHNDAEIYKLLGNKKPTLVSPFGIDINNYEKLTIPSDHSENNHINFIGALDWTPNQYGLLWFIDKCFPLILREFPNINLNIAGRNAPNWFINKLNRKNIVYFGEVDNAYEFIQKKGPVIVPLFSGSGMRVKIIESMALRKAVVATKIAVEGIQCQPNKHVLLADTPKEFARQTIAVLNNLEKQDELGKNSFKLVKEKFDNNRIGVNIINFINN